jgi:GntR family transcriptional regulator
MNSLSRSNPLPLWAQLEGRLRARILANEFDEHFPTDEQLVHEYGVSRHTVREAVRRLQSAGLVQRERGRGSSVAADRPLEQSISRFYSLAASIEAQGLEEHSDVLIQALETDATAAARLQLEPSDGLVHIRRLRFAGDEPLSVDDSWLPPQTAAFLLDADLQQGSLYELLSHHAGIVVSGGSERIEAAAPDAATRKLLALPRGEAVLRIERLVLSNGRPIEFRRSVVRGDRFAFVADWNAESRLG